MSEAPDASIQSLQRLARGLLFDRHAAEDVNQDARLAALRSGAPESPSAPG